MSRTKNTVLNALWGVFTHLFLIFLRFFCRTVFIKTLGTTYLGINGLFSDVLVMLSLAELGFDSAISYRLYKPIADNEVAKVVQYVYFFRNIYRIVGVVIFSLGLVCIPFLSYIIADYDSILAKGINVSLIFFLFLIQNVSSYFFGAYRSTVLRVNQKMYILEKIELIVKTSSSISQIIVLICFQNFMIYICTLTIYTIIQNIVNGICAYKMYPIYFGRPAEKLHKIEIIAILKDCAALFVYKINNVVMKATDNIVLSVVLGLSIVGLYSNYVIIYVAITATLQRLLNAVKDSLGNLFVSNDLELKYFFFEVVNYVVIVLYGTAAIGMAICCNKIIKLWIGGEFVISGPFVIFIAVELLLTGLKQNLAQMRHVSGIFRQMWFRPVIGSIINVLFSFLLTYFYGFSGVVIGTIMAALFANLMIDPGIIHKYTFCNYRNVIYYYKKNILYLILLIFVGLIDYKICNMFDGSSEWLALIFSIFVSVVSVPTIFIAFFYKKNECVYLKSKLYSLVIHKNK